MLSRLKNEITKYAVSDIKEPILLEAFKLNAKAKNELLFFMKPECFFYNSISSIVDLIFQNIIEHDITVSGCAILNGEFLGKYKIIDKHYGAINIYSKSVSKILDSHQIKDLYKKLNLTDEKYDILGGHEAGEKYNIDGEELERIWRKKDGVKIASGFYADTFKINGDDVILVNGFHPLQIKHFTNPMHKIVVFTVQSDEEWSVLKGEFAGDTYPSDASPESIRGALLKNMNNYGIDEVSARQNFIHLSAGPFEAFFEIYNFLSSLDIFKFNIKETNMFVKMKNNGIDYNLIMKTLKNPHLQINNNASNLFGVTENLNSLEAIDKLESLIEKNALLLN